LANCATAVSVLASGVGGFIKVETLLDPALKEEVSGKLDTT